MKRFFMIGITSYVVFFSLCGSAVKAGESFQKSDTWQIWEIYIQNDLSKDEALPYEIGAMLNYGGQGCLTAVNVLDVLLQNNVSPSTVRVILDGAFVGDSTFSGADFLNLFDALLAEQVSPTAIQRIIDLVNCA